MRHQRFLVLDTPLPEHVEAKPGDYVYSCKGYDYGCAADDTRATGVKHVSVTASRFGGYPFFTIPEHALGAAEDVAPEYPTEEHAKMVCKIGQGEETCRYLVMGAGGFSCEKHSGMSMLLNSRVLRGEMTAKGDNCEGLYSR